MCSLRGMRVRMLRRVLPSTGSFTGMMCARREQEQEMPKPAAPPQKTVLETILDWSIDRPLWQRDALRRIIAQGRVTQEDVTELVELCKIGRGAPADKLTAIPLTNAHLPAIP